MKTESDQIPPTHNNEFSITYDDTASNADKEKKTKDCVLLDSDTVGQHGDSNGILLCVVLNRLVSLPFHKNCSSLFTYLMNIFDMIG